MIIGKVVGSIVSTRKHEALVGNKFLIVESLQKTAEEKNTIVAIDVVGAGVGETVLVVTGSSARCATSHDRAPVDAAIVGIVDEGSNFILDRL